MGADRAAIEGGVQILVFENVVQARCGRGRGFASAVAPVADAAVDHLPARVPADAEWNLTGPWTITEQCSVPESTPRESGMYQLAGLGAYGPHVLRLEVRGRLRLFAFTFR